MVWKLKKVLPLLLELIILCYTIRGTAVDNRECREQEYRDEAGDCVACRQCGSGQELSMECGFGYGEGALCAPCRPGRYKEAGGQKCKPCLSCAHTSRLHRANCTATGNAVCGDCLPGFYRKTKLSGFQDMDCVPCGDHPHANEPLCSSRVNRMPLSSVVASPRDTVLAVVVCIALASVLLALMLFCAIYCKRQLEKKPHEPCQGGSCYDAEFPSFEHSQVHQIPRQTTSNCYHGTGITCGPVKLFPYQFSEEPCSMEHSSGFRLHCSQNSNGMATYPAWESQRRPLENTLPSEVNHDLYQTDLEVSDEELALEDDGTLLAGV